MTAHNETTVFHLQDMCCADEERSVRTCLESLEGIDAIKFDLLARNVVIRHTCSRHVLSDALRGIGFPPRLPAEPGGPSSFWERHQILIMTCASGALLAAGLIGRYGGAGAGLTQPLFLAAMAVGGWKTFVKAFHAARHLMLDMNILMVIAVAGAVAINKAEEGAAVIVLFSIANLLEQFSVERVRRRIRSLMNLTPETATVVENGRERLCAVREIPVGTAIVVRPGDRIPLDGVVVSGSSSVNQAPITGESRTVAKQKGGEVFAGSLNGSGSLTIQVIRPFYDTTIANIVRKVEQAQAERAQLQTTGERFAKYYTPVVVILAALVTIVPPLALAQPFETWFYRALVLLVIACPCALVISTPVTIVSGIANAARHGVLIKGGRHLESMASLDAIAFDKTGTLTLGASQVADVIPLNSMTPAEILRLAAAIESKSEHPLAGAVLKSASGESIPAGSARFQHFESLAGRGVTATIDGQAYFIGNHALVEEMNLCSERLEGILEDLEAKGMTTIILGTLDQPIGVMGITDDVREESAAVIRSLHAMGIRKTIMMTGDSTSIAEEIAAETGIDEVYAHLLPAMKTRRMASLKESYGNVAMVGDGINDAPALAAATVGIAMGGGGTDVAAETADIVLMADDLSKIPQVIAIGRKTVTIIKQNIAFALIVKLIFVGFGILGGVSLWLAILADDGATLLVILNGMRALRS